MRDQSGNKMDRELSQIKGITRRAEDGGGMWYGSMQVVGEGSGRGRVWDRGVGPGCGTRVRDQSGNKMDWELSQIKGITRRAGDGGGMWYGRMQVVGERSGMGNSRRGGTCEAPVCVVVARG